MVPVGERGRVLITGLSVLETLGRHADGLGVTDLAREVGGDKGNVHRITQLLCEQGYVEQDEISRRYTLTSQIVQLAGRALRQLDVRGLAEPVLRRLSAATGESVHLAVRTRAGGVYVSQIRAANRLSVETDIGSSPIVHATATGKALFAHAADAVLDAALDGGLERYTIRTVTSRRALDDMLAEVRSRGYAIDDEELNADVRCVAAPLFDGNRAVTAAIGVSGPVSRIPVSRLPELGELVRAASDQVTASIGGERPGSDREVAAAPAG
ncbi:IclR family transcriptional regulator [Pseudonocardia nematodicida]|uniref:IclR family transcriptional regulator n=1 Tax=Pseudonocardia nematodicida TaxID=1206997 RepID=A0ABV1KE50_9PSEU